MTSDKKIYDLAIIGGGINGAGIARDAAGQGWQVALIEKDDLAAATSSASSKFIHGGLRYLEHYAFGLVHKALKEREVLMSIAPHIIQPLRFVLPHEKNMRPLWLIRCGLFLYDHLGGKTSLPKSKLVNLHEDSLGDGLQHHLDKGFAYSDCGVDDARLVVLNALSAQEKGADVLTYEGCDYISAESENKLWRLRLKSGKQIWAKMIVNAAGPWVRQFLGDNGLSDWRGTSKIRLVRGSHIVLPPLYEGEHAYILQNNDGRIVFAWPYHGYTAVGTTDIDMGDDPDEPVRISQEETNYLLGVVNSHFERQCSTQDIVNSWSGVRALADDKSKAAKAASRDYKLQMQYVHDLPILSIFGGKLTTYRKLAEEAVAQCAEALDYKAQEWTHEEALPGGDFEKGAKGLKAFMDAQWKRYPWLPQGLLLRYCTAYGSKMDDIIGKAHSLKDLGTDFGRGLYQKEVDYLIKTEWALESDDILWRRSKLGLLNDQELEQRLKTYLRDNT